MQSASAGLHCHLWPVRLYQIFHIISKDRISGKKLSNTQCVSLQLLSETFLILRRMQQGIIINIQRSSCKYLLFLPDFNETWIFLADFRKILKYEISWKSIQWEPSCSMRTEQTDGKIHMTKLTVAFCNFSNAPRNKTWFTQEWRRQITVPWQVLCMNGKQRILDLILFSIVLVLGFWKDFGITYLYIWTLIFLYVSVKYNSTSKAYPKIPKAFTRTEKSK
jgi:hypothetical protein